MPSLVLASASPRRRQFLSELGYELRVDPADIDESVRNETAQPYAARLAGEKAHTVAARNPGCVVLAADTVVVASGQLLGKPASEPDFRRMMELLSGRPHEVITAVAVRDAAGKTTQSAVVTQVRFRALSAEDIVWYWASGEPLDKAGGYALQGRGGAFISSIDGSHSNVIGLPLVETIELLRQAGIPPPWAAP